MAHKHQRWFFLRVKEKFPERFDGCSVLDIGSLDINGNNHHLFKNYLYVGIDVGPGPNVNIVSKGHEFNTEQRFDIVISSECFEHDMYYPETIKNAVRLTKPGGMFLFTCASTGRSEHGTLRTRPKSSPHTSSIPGWENYYKNLTEEDIRSVIDVEKIFSTYYFEYNEIAHDLYFWGIKNP